MMDEADRQKCIVCPRIRIFIYSFNRCQRVTLKRYAMPAATTVIACPTRCSFLRKAKNISDWSKVVFLDETWNANHTVSKSWTDDTAQSCNKVPQCRRERLIICHAGSASGFVPNSLLLFMYKNTEYHAEMKYEKFKDYFIGLLNHLKEPITIIIDNASYHSLSVILKSFSYLITLKKFNGTKCIGKKINTIYRYFRMVIISSCIV